MVAKKSIAAQMVEAFPFAATDDELVRALSVYQAKELRTACTRLHLNSQADPQTNNKDGYIELLRSYRHQRRDGIAAAMGGPQKTSGQSQEERSTQHGRFRLMNVVFGETLIDRMGEIDGIPGREAVDSGAVNGNSHYWQDAAEDFVGSLPSYDRLIKSRDEYEDIHPGETPQLSPVKLEKMWKELRILYSTAKKNSVNSGTHDRDFSLYCGGRLDVLYMHDWLQKRPGYEVYIVGQLPENARVNTLRAKRAAAISQQHQGESKRHRPASVALEGKILEFLSNEKEDEDKVSAVNQAADLADAVHKGMKVIKDMKETGADDLLIKGAQQALDLLIPKWVAEMGKVTKAT